MGYSFKNGITIIDSFQKILDVSNQTKKANKTRVDKGSEFYNR